MWRREGTAFCFLVLAAVVSVDSLSLSKSKSEEEEEVSALKRAISAYNGGGGRTALRSDDSREASGNATTEMSAEKVRVADLTGDRAGISVGASRSISIVTQTLLTFVTVFFFGCAIVLAIFAWKRFSDSPFRTPLSYQYSALSQFDADPDDDELNDLEDNLNVLVEDSSSDEDEEFVPKASASRPTNADEAKDDDDDDDVFVDDPNIPATLPVTENTEAKLSVGSQGSLGSRASRRGSAASSAGGRGKDLMMDSEPT